VPHPNAGDRIIMKARRAETMRQWWITALIAFVGLWPLNACAQLVICNRTVDKVTVTIVSSSNLGWPRQHFILSPNDCGDGPQSPLKDRYYYFFAQSEYQTWQGGPGSRRVITVHFVGPGGGHDEYEDFSQIDVGEIGKDRYVLDLTSDTRGIPEVKMGVVSEKCLISWDDSPNVHSVSFSIQRPVKIIMKKLRHCIQLRVLGPMNLGGIANSYVSYCVNRALNDGLALHIVEALAALTADVLLTRGGATSAKVADYVHTVSRNTIDCLTNTTGLQSYLKGYLQEKFDASISEESHWIYWEG
jgi:hypothetical protein